MVYTPRAMFLLLPPAVPLSPRYPLATLLLPISARFCSPLCDRLDYHLSRFLFLSTALGTFHPTPLPPFPYHLHSAFPHPPPPPLGPLKRFRG